MKRLLTTIYLLICSYMLCMATQKIRLWEGTPVKAKNVTLEVFSPKETSVNKQTAIIVCPGGSYCWHDYKTEGKGVAEWLSENGFTAFVLRYRVQGKFQYVTRSRYLFRGHQHPDMISDLQRAIQYVREHADEYQVQHVGAMGFSAGGHLVMSGAAYAGTDFLKPLGIEHHSSLRPDFVAPIYPVVSLSHPCSHKRSRRALLGDTRKGNKILRDSLSLEKHIPKDCPPVFLVNCVDDPIVKYHNSEMLDSALTAQGIAHKYIQYQTGGHGFGASEKKGTVESRQWKNEFLTWITTILK